MNHEDSEVLDGDSGKPRGRFGLRGKAVLGLLLVALLLVRVDALKLTPARVIASPHIFSLVEWEIVNFPRKWLHRLWELLPGKTPSREERLALIEEYLDLARRVRKEENRIEGLHISRSATRFSGGAAKEKATPDREYLNELLGDKEGVRARAEEAMEAEVSAVVIEQGLGRIWGLVFPPVDLRFDQPPTLLVTSPRDRIKLVGADLLDPDLTPFERNRLENRIEQEQDLSALVDSLAGLATYPTLVNDLYTLRRIAQTAAHEWLHTYFFFRPLGQHLRSSDDMYTLNETVASLAGRELGDMVFARMGGDLSISASRYLAGEDIDPKFTQIMRETRLRTDELLAEGKVDEAEQYMKERWWYLRLGGYGVRKLNQAYFAFRGYYAESPGSVSAIGDQVEELRDMLPDVGEFIKTTSGVSSYQEFLDLLERLKAREGG